MRREDPERIASLQKGRAKLDARRRAERLEDLTFMATTGECTTGAATRLGLSRGGLEHWLRDHAPHLLPVLNSREPRDPNQRPGLPPMQNRRAG